MSNVIIELAKQPIFGVVVGALLALLTTHLVERRKWKREDLSRFHQLKVEIYSEMLTDIQEILFAYLMMSEPLKETLRSTLRGEYTRTLAVVNAEHISSFLNRPEFKSVFPINWIYR